MKRNKDSTSFVDCWGIKIYFENIPSDKKRKWYKR